MKFFLAAVTASLLLLMNSGSAFAEPINSIFNETDTTGDNLGLVLLPKTSPQEDQRFVLLNCEALGKCSGLIGRAQGYSIKELSQLVDQMRGSHSLKQTTGRVVGLATGGLAGGLTAMLEARSSFTLARSGIEGAVVGLVVMYLADNALDNDSPNYTRLLDSMQNLITFAGACSDPSNEGHGLNWIYLVKDKKISEFKADLNQILEKN